MATLSPISSSTISMIAQYERDLKVLVSNTLWEFTPTTVRTYEAALRCFAERGNEAPIGPSQIESKIAAIREYLTGEPAMWGLSNDSEHAEFLVMVKRVCGTYASSIKSKTDDEIEADFTAHFAAAAAVSRTASEDRIRFEEARAAAAVHRAERGAAGAVISEEENSLDEIGKLTYSFSLSGRLLENYLSDLALVESDPDAPDFLSKRRILLRNPEVFMPLISRCIRFGNLFTLELPTLELLVKNQASLHSLLGTERFELSTFMRLDEKNIRLILLNAEAVRSLCKMGLYLRTIMFMDPKKLASFCEQIKGIEELAKVDKGIVVNLLRLDPSKIHALGSGFRSVKLLIANKMSIKNILNLSCEVLSMINENFFALKSFAEKYTSFKVWLLLSLPREKIQWMLANVPRCSRLVLVSYRDLQKIPLKRFDEIARGR